MMAPMSRDYASRSTRTAKPRPRSGARKRPAKATAGTDRGIWSAPSFSAGVIFGAALVLLLSYAPTAFENTVAAARGPISEPENITFEFEDILENGTVEVDPNTYEASFPGENPDEPAPEYQIQAISVKSASEATGLTRQLISMGLPARSERVDLSSGPWYRVMVGPYESKRKAERVINQLEELNMLPELR